VTIDGQPTPAASAPAGPRRAPRLRRLLLIVVGFLVVLGVLAGGALLLFYDRTTAIDRSTPQVAADQFLDAALVLRDPDRVALFICDEWSAQAAVAQAGAPTDPRVVMSWGDSTVTVAGRAAIAVIDVRFTVRDDGGLHEDVQTWTLQLEDDDGWRVCSLSKDALLQP
jgi:hypothetical protein